MRLSPLVLAGVLCAGWLPLPGAEENPEVDLLDPRTEKVIEGALKYMASQQKADGSWGVSSEERRHPVALTAYTLMAFQAAGNLPNEGKHGKVVAKGLKYLLDKVGADGVFGNATGQYMYGHGIATIALAELYGQTKDENIRGKLDRAIKLIIASQSRTGGWRYRPVSSDADISVTVLQVVALRAAKNSGIQVPPKTIEEAIKYVKACYHSGSGGFGYQPGSGPGFARTAAAVYSLQVCGLYDDPMVDKGCKYLESNNTPSAQWYVYGNFYAAPAQYMHRKGWEKWYKSMQAIILKPGYLTSDASKGIHYWNNKGRGGVGPIYTTAVFTTILAMPYHYIPLYQR